MTISALTLSLLLAAQEPAPTFLKEPVWVYCNWSAYDELSDTVRLTEALAMRQLDEIVRLKKLGVRIDYYLMDAFWFDPDGGYRTWRKPDWPDGPDRWLEACRKNGLVPGLWFAMNSLKLIRPAPAWKDSVNGGGTAMSLHEGGFLPDFMDALQHWYDRGVRLYKFDFAGFSAATPKAAPGDVRRRNEDAFRNALRQFRAKNPDVILEAFNGFGGDIKSTSDPFPFRQPVDVRWLEVFDALYSGDPRPGDVPQMNFWRSMDVYSDHTVRRYEQAGVPLERIDSSSFMCGTTGTIYNRGINGWQGMLLLLVARGGWINTLHGNLELVDEAKCRWLAKVQSIWGPLQAARRTRTFGAIPGEGRPYGFASEDAGGAVCTVVNPAQAALDLQVPHGGRLLFRDAGYEPLLQEDKITLGPGQLAVVGYGRYAAAEHDLGIQEDVRIPREIRAIEVRFERNEATLTPPAAGDIRIVVQQRGKDGSIRRSKTRESMGRVVEIRASQGGKEVPVAIDYDRVIWSGLSWGVGEIRRATFDASQPLTIRCRSTEKEPVVLEATLYQVTY